MECKFVVGQKVVCVDDTPFEAGWNFVNNRQHSLKLNKIYTIEDIYSIFGFYGKEKGVWITVVLAEEKKFARPGKEKDTGFNINRFRPLDEIRKEKFKQMVNNIPSPFYNEVVKENELV